MYKHISNVLALVALIASSIVWGQEPPAQGSAGVAAQGSASAQRTPQGAQAAASGGAQGSAAATAPAGNAGVGLAEGSSMNAVLTKPVDSRHSKPGDPVTAKTTRPAKTEDGTPIPRGSTLLGHVEPVQAGASGAAGSSIGLVFDRAVTKGGHEVHLRNVAIRALAASESAAAMGVGDSRAMMGTTAGMAGGARGGMGGGGLVGHAAGAVGVAGGAVGGAGSLGASGVGALQPGPGAIGGVDATGMLTSESSGVFGLRGLGLVSSTFGSTAGSVVTSSGKSLRLDQGTQLLLTSSAGTADSKGSDSKSPAKKPDREDRR